MKKKVTGWLGKTIPFLCLAAFAVLFCMALSLNILPNTYVAVLAAVILALTAIVALLTWSGKSKVRFILGTLLAVIFIILSIVGTYYISKTAATAQKITTPTVETTEVGIFVRTEDAENFSENASGYVYGFLTELDRENTDAAIEAFNREDAFILRTTAYDGLTDLADALLETEDVDAMILNTAYLDVLEEMDGYEDIMDRIVQVTYQSVSKEAEVNADSEKETGLSEGTELSDSIFTVFISGIDSRKGLIAKSLSDVNILAVVNAETRQILLVSTPRDYYVPLSISNGKKDKLTHAGIYGINVCMDTISMLYDVDIDYFFRLNFTGFVDIVDALGGITVVSDYTFTAGNYSFVKGENQLDGTAALAFCRERHAFATGDRQRGKNQLAAIKGIVNKVTEPSILMNYSSFLSALEGSFETSIPYSLISELVKAQLTDNSAWDIVSYSVDGTGDSQIPYSMSQYAYVMVPDESTVETAKELIQTVLDGEIVSDPQ